MCSRPYEYFELHETHAEYTTYDDIDSSSDVDYVVSRFQLKLKVLHDCRYLYYSIKCYNI